MNIDVSYGINRRLPGVGFDEARARITEALKAEGFGVLTEIDMKATLKKKLDVDVDAYVILGACNPKLAYKALTIDAGVGLLLPCNVVVSQSGDDVVISAVNPRAMFSVVENGAALAPVVDEVEQRLRRAIAAA